MKNKRLSFAIIAGLSVFLAGCQSVPFLQPTTTSDESWTGMHLDQVQFTTESAGFTCMAPSGVDFDSRGEAFRRSMCFKTDDCRTINRVFYLEAHTMIVTSTKESSERVPLCQPPAPAAAPSAKEATK